ncbi:hypothetical protein ACFL96_09935 [Thermoproteota archaeon]
MMKKKVVFQLSLVFIVSAITLISAEDGRPKSIKNMHFITESRSVQIMEQSGVQTMQGNSRFKPLYQPQTQVEFYTIPEETNATPSVFIQNQFETIPKKTEASSFQDMARKVKQTIKIK